MNELALRQAGLSELACQFARFINRLNQGDDELIATTAALLVEAVSQGHVCLNLAVTHTAEFDLPQFPEWLKHLQKSYVIGKIGEFKPLILTNDGRLYLYRHWQEEQLIANAIKQRCKSVTVKNSERLQDDFADWHSTITGVDWQKVAVLVALTRQFSVISGGPGTGKTTIILRLLHMFQGQDADITIALAAPTGKAAARLQQVVNDNGQTTVEAKTLHRLLGITPSNEQGRYNQKQPLAIDVLIVDEASMIDISLMAKLMQALPDHARLILLGDSQQLASVESGAILANLCVDAPAFSAGFIAQAHELVGTELPISNKTDPLVDSRVYLQHSYRFEQHSDIGRLATAVQSGDSQFVFDVIANTKKPIWQQQCDSINVLAMITTLYQAFFETIKSNANAMHCLQQFGQQRVLCALKQGPQSVQSVNDLIERHIQKQGWRIQQGFYHGRPIMVTQNDYRQQLFNGDTGLILRDENGELKACFLFDNSLHWFELARLPAHETAYAITIHKSQGSEFDNVCIMLAEEESPLLTKELLYTAITRAKNQVMLLCSEAILTKTVVTQHQRETGLAGLLQD